VSDTYSEKNKFVTPGNLLVAARETQTFSQADVAKRLHLSVHTINCIENNDFADLGARTFVRGYLCAYARLVGILPEKILELVEASGLMPAEKPITASDANILIHNATYSRFTFGAYKNWICSLVVVFIVACILIGWHFAHQDGSTAKTPLAHKIIPHIKTSAATGSAAMLNKKISAQIAKASVLNVKRSVKTNSTHTIVHQKVGGYQKAALHPTYTILPAHSR